MKFCDYGLENYVFLFESGKEIILNKEEYLDLLNYFGESK